MLFKNPFARKLTVDTIKAPRTADQKLSTCHPIDSFEASHEVNMSRDALTTSKKYGAALSAMSSDRRLRGMFSVRDMPHGREKMSLRAINLCNWGDKSAII